MSFLHSTEEYYQKFIELQEKLRKSEEERLTLEMKFNEMMQVSKEGEQAHYRKLRNQYKRFVEEDRRRQERNEKIMRILERIEGRAAMLAAKTERFELLRHQYQAYIRRLFSNAKHSHEQLRQPQLQQQNPIPTISEEKIMDSRQIPILKKSVDEIRQNMDTYDHPTVRKALFGNKDDPKLGPKVDVVKQYLHSLSTPISGEEVLKATRSSDKIPLIHETEYTDSNESTPYGDDYSYYRSNNAGHLAQQIIHSINSKPKLSSPYHRNHYPNREDIDRDENYVYSQDRYCGTTLAPSKLPDKKYSEDVEVFNYSPDDNQFSHLNNEDFPETLKTGVTFKDESANLGDEEKPIKYISNEEHINFEDKNPNLIEQNAGEENPDEVDVRNTCEQVGQENEYDHQTELTEINNEETDGGKERFHNKDYDKEIDDQLPHDQKAQEQMYDPDKEIDEMQEEQNEPTTNTVFNEQDANEEYYQEYDKQYQTYDENGDPAIEQEVIQSNVVECEEKREVENAPAKNQHQDYIQQNQTIARDAESKQPQISNDELPKEYDTQEQQAFMQSNKEGQSVQYEKNEQHTTEYNKDEQSFVEHNKDEQFVMQQNDKDREQQHLQQHGEVEQQSAQHAEGPQNVQYDQNGKPIMPYDKNGQPVLEYTKNGQLVTQYDKNGQPMGQYDTSGQPTPQYDKNGQPFMQYDKNGQPITQYDKNGQPITQYDKNGQPIAQYSKNEQPIMQSDENEQPVAQYNNNGQPIAQYDRNGEPVAQYDRNVEPVAQYEKNEQPIVQYDKNGQPIVQYDKNRQPIVEYDKDGQPTMQYDKDGQPIMQQYHESEQPIMQQYDKNDQPIMQYDQNNQPITQYDENEQPIQHYPDNIQYNEHGQPIMQYDEHGQTMMQYDEHGHPIMQYDENGQPLMQYDDNGQPILQYDENGQPILYDHTQSMMQYDQHGQPIPQYDEHGQPIMYDENGQPIVQYNENGQPIYQYGQSEQYYPDENQVYQSNENQVIEQQYQEVPKVPQNKEDSKKAPTKEQAPTDLKKESNQKQKPQNSPAKVPDKKSNVMEMLDTDTESSKQETKVSNDSDFDFSK